MMMHVPPERDFDRRAQLINLLPGQRELREEARQMKVIGASLRQNPKPGADDAGVVLHGVRS